MSILMRLSFNKEKNEMSTSIFFNKIRVCNIGNIFASLFNTFSNYWQEQININATDQYNHETLSTSSISLITNVILSLETEMDIFTLVNDKSLKMNRKRSSSEPMFKFCDLELCED